MHNATKDLCGGMESKMGLLRSLVGVSPNRSSVKQWTRDIQKQIGQKK